MIECDRYIPTIIGVSRLIDTSQNWLVVWLPFFIFPYTGMLIIPIDELIFFRGVALAHQPDNWAKPRLEDLRDLRGPPDVAPGAQRPCHPLAALREVLLGCDLGSWPQLYDTPIGGFPWQWGIPVWWFTIKIPYENGWFKQIKSIDVYIIVYYLLSLFDVWHESRWEECHFGFHLFQQQPHQPKSNPRQSKHVDMCVHVVYTNMRPS